MQNATDTTPPTGYGIRRCRDHWHIVDAESGEDVAVDGDPFPTMTAALDVADRMNDPLAHEPSLVFDGYLTAILVPIKLDLPPQDFD